MKDKDYLSKDNEPLTVVWQEKEKKIKNEIR